MEEEREKLGGGGGFKLEQDDDGMALGGIRGMGGSGSFKFGGWGA